MKTLDEMFNKKADQKDECNHFYRLLTLQAKHGFSGKKDAKALAAEFDACRRMNGSKKDGWIDPSERISNMLLRQNIIDFKSTSSANRDKTLTEIKRLLHKNLTNDIIPPEESEEKQSRYKSSLEKDLNRSKLLKKKWDELCSRKTKDDNVKAHFEPIAGADFLCLQKMNDAQCASFLDLMENESTKLKDNVTLLPFFKQDLENNKTVFGSRGIHHRIIQRDMELLGKNSAMLQKDERFLEVWAAKQERVTDSNPIYGQPTKYLAKLKKWMDQYMKGGAPSLKALILYNILADNERLGKYDKELFRKYLSVPKSTAYNQTVVATKKWKKLARLDYTISTPALCPIENDEELVYRYFRKMFQKKDEQIKKWTEFVDTDYLKAVMCESRLMNDASGKGADLKKTLTKVRGKYAVQELENKVVIELEQENQRYYQKDDTVKIKVLVKNVEDLMVNVYMINQKNYYLENGEEVDINMKLDGLTAKYVIRKQFKESPFVLRSRTIEIKEIKDQSGVFLVDILGNGKRARCLIRKGYLRYICRQEFRDENDDGDFQYIFTVMSQDNTPVSKSRISLNGEQYTSDEDGNVFVPFAAKDSPAAPMILEDLEKGESKAVETATLQFFDYRTENYSTETGLYLDRESLLENKTCKIFIRPNLFLNEQPVSCKALRDSSLLVRAYVGGGGNSDDNPPHKVMIKKFRLTLSDTRETTVEYDVPAELRKVELTLSGKVWVGSQKKFQALSNSSTFEVNAIDDSQALGQCVLIPADNKYLLKAMGKNGENVPGAKLLLKLKHQYFKNPLEYRVQTDRNGIVNCGDLPDIEWMEVLPLNELNKTLLFDSQTFVVPRNTVNIPEVIAVKAGQDVLIPLITDNIQPRCDVYDANFIRIYEMGVSFNAGYIKISNLPAGDFVAMIRDTQNADVRIHVSKNLATWRGHSMAKDRIVELSEPKSLQIVQVKGSRGSGYKVKLDGFNSRATRLHAISSFGVPHFDVFDFLASPCPNPVVYNFASYPMGTTPDRDVSAEENYVLKRRGAVQEEEDRKEREDDDSKENMQRGQRFGNVLNTPSLLLNKWTDEKVKSGISTETLALMREESERQMEQAVEPVTIRTLARFGKPSREESDPSNLDMLGFPARMAVNLEPDKNGIVAIPHSILEPNHNLLTIVALDDNNTSVKYERLSSVSKVPFSDTRLSNGLDPNKQFSEVRDVLLQQSGETVTFDNWPTTTLETYDDFSDVFELYYSIADMDRNLEDMKRNLFEFRFLANWNGMTQEEKMAKFSQYACNELNLFLKNKDGAFFKAVVLPFLQNRLQKSFFDWFLLGNEAAVKKYQRLDLYHTLNQMEKILLASVVGGRLAENTVRNLRDAVSLKADLVQEFNALFQQALNAKQFEVTSLSTMEAENGADSPSEDTDDDSGDLSRQYQESRYFRVDYSAQSADLIGPNAFWLDYAVHMLEKGGSDAFLSKNFGFAANNTTEALLALSVISLPFRGDHEPPTMEIIADDGSTKLKSYTEGATVTVTTNGPTMLLVRSLQESEFKSSSLAVSTNYFDPQDCFEEVDFEKVDKFVNQQQFAAGKTYGCRVVITNVSSVKYQVQLLCQIPTGSIPVNGGFRTKNFDVSLHSYATSSLEYYFYFPEAGSFVHFPAHISRNGGIIGRSLNAVDIGVVDASEVFDRNSFAYMASSKPEAKDVLEWVKTAPNLRQCDLSKLAWRCADEKFFRALTNVLRTKQLFEAKIWRYSLVHKCEQEAEEYLVRSEKLMRYMAPSLTAENTGDALFLNYNAIERGTYRHVEFFKRDENVLGLFNTRIHSNKLFGKHQRFKTLYREFLKRLLYRSWGLPTMTPDDQFCFIFYLIAQNRVKEATAVYKAMDGKVAKKTSAMMYDYVGVFLSFFEEDSTKALSKESLVHKWLSTKLPTTKRKMWSAVKKQMEELKNGGTQKILSEFQDTENAKKAKLAQPKLNFIIDAAKKQIRVKSKNIQTVTANFYAINIEQLFSISPFTAGRDALSYVQPTASINFPAKKKEEVKERDDYSESEDSEAEDQRKRKMSTAKKANSDVVNTQDFPKGFSEKSNFVVELLGDGTTGPRVAKTQFNNSLYVEFNKSRGDMFVGNFSKFPEVRAYVKVYLATERNPDGFFLKDGYTDLRGRFDYLSSNTDASRDGTKVAVLVVSESCGANVYYADIQK